MPGNHVNESEHAAEIAALRRRLAELEDQPAGGNRTSAWFAANGSSIPLVMAAMEQSREGLAVVDLKGDLLFVNNSFAAMHGYEPAEILGRNLSIFHTSEQMPAVEAANHKMLETGQFTGEIEHLRRDGTTFPGLMHNSLLRDADGQVIGMIGTLIDITELKQAKVALRESEEKYRGLFENAQIGMFRTRVEDGLFLEVNQRLAEMLGYQSREEVIGHISTASLYQDPHNRQRMLDELHTTGGISNYECRLHRKDGSILWVRFSGKLHAEQGYIEGVAADITEHKSAEQALVESERLFRAVFNQAYQFVGVLTLDGTIIAANNTARKFAGVAESKFLGKPFWDTPWWSHSREQRRKLRDAIHTAAQGRYVRFETTHPKPDGTLINVDFSLTPVKDENDNVILLVPEGRDITKRKTAEQALRESEERYRVTVEQTGQMVYDYNPATGHIRWLGANEEMTGYNDEEFSKVDITQWEKMIHPEDRANTLTALQYSEQRCQRYDVTYRFRRKDGSYIHVEDHGVFLPDEHGSACRMLGTMSNITARKKAEAEKERLEAQLRHAQKMEAVGRLAGGVAHDFNNILTTILGNVELSLDTVRTALPQDKELHSGLKQVERAAERAAALTRQLLVFSRRDVMHADVLNLNSTLKEMSKMLRRLITEDIALETIAAPHLHQIRADAGQIEQVIMNLVVNARDAMPDGGQLTLETDNVNLDDAYVATHHEARSGSYVMLTVSDTGCGMESETIERIFEPFYTTKPVGQGTGLGLATVYAIVKRAGGHVMVYSEPKRGTTFKVYLPAIETPATSNGVSAPTAKIRSGTETILICEDDKNVRDLTAHILTEAGYHVLKAAGGPAAIKQAAAYQGSIDLLISDVIMPTMNGKQLSDVLVATRPALRTLFMSGYTSNVIAHHGVLDEGVEFIEKPFSRRNILKHVRAILDRAAQPPV